MSPGRDPSGRFLGEQKTDTIAPVSRRFFRVPLEEIAYVRAVLEGYDGLAVLRSPDPRRGEVEWLIGEGLEDDADALLRVLEKEAGLIEIPQPPDWPAAPG